MNNYPPTTFINPVTGRNSKSNAGTVVLGFNEVGRAVYQVYHSPKGLVYEGKTDKIIRHVTF